jgi:hypothetical protein
MSMQWDEFMKLVEASMGEISDNGLEHIQYMTAYKWAARAIAAKMMDRDVHEVTEYSHEALEHAALIDDESVLADIRQLFRTYSINT